MPKHEIIISADVEDVDEKLDSFISKVIRTALDAEGVKIPCEVNVLVANDAGIHQVNLDMRNVDAPTDVLSFPTGLVPLGDMCISMERVRAQAEEYGHSPRRELAYLAVHSVLHLLGYDHLDEGPMKAQMRRREEDIMRELGLERGQST